MLSKSEGIVLKKTPFKDHSAIVHIYSPDWGYNGFLVHGIKKNLLKSATFQNLNIVELNAYIKPQESLHTLKESKVQFAFEFNTDEQAKTSMALFMNELYYKVCRNNGPDAELYHSMKVFLLQLQHTETQLAHFPIVLILNLYKCLGFTIECPPKALPYFDLKQGKFSTSTPSHPLFIDDELSLVLFQYLSMNKEHSYPKVSHTLRKLLLYNLCRYLEIHIEGFGKMNSLDVLAEIS
jgi:DNA repair protein RecO (recombination protein O)